MTLSSYDAVIEDSGHETRAREQQALNHGIDLLRRLQSGALPPPEDAEALLYIR
jgi:flagellar biosynthesis activator protein FlaF